MQAGCLLVLNNQGEVVETISGGHINGPWDAIAFDGGHTAAVFVTNVLNGTLTANGGVAHGGTVVRLLLSMTTTSKPQVMQSTIVGSGFAERTDPSALVVGPTGVVLDDDNDTLYVNDSVNSTIQGISNPLQRKASAGRGVTISRSMALNDPLGLTRAPNGDLIAANGGNGNLVEVTPGGAHVTTKQVDSSGSPPGAGALFGLSAGRTKIYFVDDATNTLNVLKP